MAEGTSGPETGSTRIEGQFPAQTSNEMIPQRPWHIAPEYDPKRAGEYRVTEEDRYKIFTDPVTGREVARVLEIAGGDEIKLNLQEKPPTWWPFAESEWTALDIKDRTVEAAVRTMRHFYDMPNTERAEAGNIEKFNAAYKDFAEYALGKKLYDGKDTRIIAVELELVNFDGEEIKKYDPGKQGQIIDALNRLDFFEREQIGVQKARADYKITDLTQVDDRLRPPHISKDEWKRYLKRPKEIDQKLQDARKEIVALTSQDFLNRRQAIKTTVEAKVEDLKVVIEKEDKEKGTQVSGEPWEKILEEHLLQDIETPIEQSNPYADKSVEQILQFIVDEGRKPANEQNAISLEQANKALEWNFHQARKLGIFDDLEERLDGRYQELALSLFSRSGADQGDMEMETRRVSRNRTLVEAKEIIAKESDEHNLNSFTITAELAESWRQLIKDGIISGTDVAHFAGIRGAFVSDAYDQMYDSLSNLYKRLKAGELKEELDRLLAQGKITQQRYDRRLNEVPIQRMSGEWDVRRQERLVTMRLDAEERAEKGKLFYVDRYYLTLTGTTIEQVERGVNNYLKSLLEGSRVYDVQTILQKLVYLSSAIFATKDTLLKNGMPGSKADEALARLAKFGENRGEFYVMNFGAQNLLMDDVFTPLYEKWGGTIGIEKLKEMLDMNDGLVAPAMLLFLDKKNLLLFQPAGFKGQGMKNIWAQRTLRNKIKEQLAEELVNYQAREVKPTELMEQTTWQDFLRKKFTDRSFKFQDKNLKPKDAVNEAKSVYEQIAKDIRENPGSTKEEIEQNLTRLRKAREESTKLRNKYDRLLAETKSAIETTWQIFNIFGETARLGAPSIIMDNGDHISIEDATYFYKFAILDAMKKNGDSPARMRWRAYRWTKKPWQYENEKPYVKTDPKRDGVNATYFLVKGLEDTGITPEVFTEFLRSAKELRANGYNAALKRDQQGNPVLGYSFEEIINRNDVKPVRNNFISNYKSSREIFANPTAMREAKKGGQPFIMNILDRLDHSGRGKFTTLDRSKIDGMTLEKLPDERLKELFEDAITDSFIFHITARQLARWEATFTPEWVSQGNMRCDKRSNIAGEFSTDRLYYGSQDIPWGVKRLQYLAEYWMTNKRERVGREWKMLPFIPLLKSGLAQECDAENLPDLIFNVNKEHIDEPGLKQIAAGFKDAQGWRQRGETSVDEQRGETVWSFWDKPTVDSAQILNVVPELPQENITGGKYLTMLDYINAPNQAEYMQKHRLSSSFSKKLVDVTREILKREAPLNVFLEAQLGYNRSAGGSGIGLEMGERWHYREMQWWLSEDEGSRQEQGGLKVNEDAATFFKFITIKNSWSGGMSILDEAWRQARGTRDAGASDQLPRGIIS